MSRSWRGMCFVWGVSDSANCWLVIGSLGLAFLFRFGALSQGRFCGGFGWIRGSGCVLLCQRLVSISLSGLVAWWWSLDWGCKAGVLIADLGFEFMLSFGFGPVGCCFLLFLFILYFCVCLA